NAFTVAISDQPTISYTGFSAIAVNSLQGDDVISITPSPTWGVNVAVNGGDPTASDELIVTGTTGSDTIGYTPQGIGVGNVAVNGAPAISFANIESLTIDGQGGNDSLTHNTPPGTDIITYTPGAAPDAGTIETRGIAGTALVPLTFIHLGGLGNVTFG